MVKGSDERKRQGDASSSKTLGLGELKRIIEEYKAKHNLNTYELIDLILSKPLVEKTYDFLPASIFSNTILSGLEIIVKYLREEFNIKFREIAALLNRNLGTITSTYRKSQSKHPDKLRISDSKFKIPLSLFADRKLSVLEHISVHLKDNYNLKLKEIASLLNKDQRTIWTCYSRAKAKEKSKGGVQ